LRLVFGRLVFEKINAAFAQRQRDLDALFPKSKLGWRRQKIADNLNLAQRLIRVSDFLCHKSAFLCASNLRQ
jgi:hypothetical protein